MKIFGFVSRVLNQYMRISGAQVLIIYGMAFSLGVFLAKDSSWTFFSPKELALIALATFAVLRLVFDTLPKLSDD